MLLLSYMTFKRYILITETNDNSSFDDTSKLEIANEPTIKRRSSKYYIIMF